MKLREWMFMNELNQTQTAKLLETNRSYFSEILNGKIRVSKKFAKRVEKMTKGKVTAISMRNGSALKHQKSKKTLLKNTLSLI